MARGHGKRSPLSKGNGQRLGRGGAADPDPGALRAARHPAVALEKIAQADRDRLGASVEMEAARRAIEAEREGRSWFPTSAYPTFSPPAPPRLLRPSPATCRPIRWRPPPGVGGILRSAPAGLSDQRLSRDALRGAALLYSWRSWAQWPRRKAHCSAPWCETRSAGCPGDPDRLPAGAGAVGGTQQQSSRIRQPSIPKPREGRAITTGYTIEALDGPAGGQ